MRVGVRSVGLVAPGLLGWAESGDCLRGARPYRRQELPKLPPRMLPANERRRTTATIHLALQAADEAASGSGVGPEELAAVFASADGDLEITDRICSTLTLPGRPVSPTQFHNSVHNAPAGYWAIGSGSMQTSSSLSAGEASFTAGLLEAATLAHAEDRPVLLVAYDAPTPPRLARFRPNDTPFAAACVLAPGDGALGNWEIAVARGRPISTLDDTGLEAVRQANGAAHSLPLLALTAAGAEGTAVLPYLADSQLEVAFRP